MVLSKDMKIAICFGLIMGALISICNMCFAAVTEVVNYDTITGVVIASNKDTFTANASGVVGYVAIEPGYKYTLSKEGGNDFPLAFSNELAAADVPYYDFNVFGPSTPFEFTYSDYKYVYFNFRAATGIVLTREPLQGMTNFVDNLAYDLSYANLSGVLFFVVPIMAIAILFGLGFYLLKRLLNKIKRAKGGA